MKQVFLVICFICATKLIGQTIFDPDPCASFAKQHTQQKKPVPYVPLREADIAWEKRIWREIDLREKQNLKYYYPVDINPCVHSLFQVLCKQILNGNILAFKDEEFVVPYERSEVRRLLVKTDTVPQYVVDEAGNQDEVMVAVTDSVSIYRNILKYRLKEDWYFDKQRSVLEVRIIGLAAYEYIEDKEAYRELFWVYFPACRETLAQASAFNTRNDNEFRSFDELFMKRDFNSLIVKESNVYDRYIYQYMKGIDALTEADDIKMDLFDWEHDLWNY